MKNMLRILDQWLQLLFTGAALCLALGFILGIFAPGNPETAFVFQAMHPVLPWIDTACAFLIQPVDKGLAFLSTNAPWLTQWVPAGIKAGFPVIPAATVAKQIAGLFLMLPHDPHGRYAQDLSHANFKWLFPGVIDWRLMMALPLWNWVESLLIGMIQWIETMAYRQKLRWENQARLKSLQAEGS